MKPLLTHPEHDFDPRAALPPHAKDLSQDLELGTLLRTMAGGAGQDKLVFDVASRAMFSGLRADAETILYRQDILKDCLKNPAQARELYALATGAIENKRGYWISVIRNYPSSTLHGAIDAVTYFIAHLRKLRAFADQHAARFHSRGLTTLLATLRSELSDAYFAQVEEHLRALRFDGGILISGELGKGNEGTNYVLRQPHGPRLSWFRRLIRRWLGQPPWPGGVTFILPGPDEAGSRILGEMRDRGVNLVANALAQSSDHILSFFDLLRTEMAFYIGCLNLHEALVAKGGGGTPIVFPEPLPPGDRGHRFTDLRDACLVLTKGEGVVGNSINADGKRLVVITGANQGGKSSFLRAVGLAQVMMQCGMFVAAESFAAEVCGGVFTHYKREEDKTMKSGKFDEELSRTSGIVDSIRPGALMLFNESFASTNAREGSEIADQITRALVERGITVFFVTHQYEFAHEVLERRRPDTLLLRAQRLPDGKRTFRLVEGVPLETSYGEDLYREVFEGGSASPSAGGEP